MGILDDYYKRNPDAKLSIYHKKCDFCGKIFAPGMGKDRDGFLTLNPICDCWQSNIDTMASETRMPPELVGVRLSHCIDDDDDNVGHIKIYSAAERWASRADQNHVLVLTGAVGTGKSYLAASIGNTMLYDKGTQFLWTSANGIIMTRSAAWNDRTLSEHDEMSKYTDIPLLIIDDIDKANYTANNIVPLWNIISVRHDYRMLTIITTNLSLEALCFKMGTSDQAYADAIYDRLRSRSTVLHLDWPSRR